MTLPVKCKACKTHLTSVKGSTLVEPMIFNKQNVFRCLKLTARVVIVTGTYVRCKNN